MSTKNILLLISIFIFSCFAPQDEEKKTRSGFNETEQTKQQEVKIDQYLSVIDSITNENNKRATERDTTNTK